MDQPGVSKKSYELLGMLDSDSSSSSNVPPLMLTSPRKKRFRRFGSRDKYADKATFERCKIPPRTVCVFFVLTVLIVWLLTMSWFINALQNELDKFNRTIVKIADGNQGVPDDLQKCHTMSKQLQQNQTDIYQRLTVYDGRITNLTSEVSLLGKKISEIEKKIVENNNELSNPVDTKNLLSEVAKLGSNYKELSESVKSLKGTTSSLQSYHTELKANMTSINDKLNNVDSFKTDKTMINNVSDKLDRFIENVNVNVSSLNQTFTNHINWLDEDKKAYGKNMEQLNEKVQGLTAQVQTISSECKTTDTKVKEVYSKLTSLENQFDQIAINVTNVHHAQPKSNDPLTSSDKPKDVKTESRENL